MMNLRIDDTLELKTLELSDSAAWFALLDANRDFLGPWIRTPARVQCLADAEAYVNRFLTERARGAAHVFGVWDSGVLAGEVLMFGIRSDDRSAEIGYWLAQEFEGRGIMTRACRALLDHAFGDLGLNRLEIRCGSENLRSQAVARKIGFTHEGTLRQAMWLNERFIDHEVFGLLASEARAAGR